MKHRMATVDAVGRKGASDIFVSGLHEAIRSPEWRFLDQGLLRPTRDQVVLAVWPDDLTTVTVVRYCPPPSGDARSAVWREALTDEETGTMDSPYAWRPLNADERRACARHEDETRWREIVPGTYYKRGSYRIELAGGMYGALRFNTLGDLVSLGEYWTLTEAKMACQDHETGAA